MKIEVSTPRWSGELGGIDQGPLTAFLDAPDVDRELHDATEHFFDDSGRASRRIAGRTPGRPLIPDGDVCYRPVRIEDGMNRHLGQLRGLVGAALAFVLLVGPLASAVQAACPTRTRKYCGECRKSTEIQELWKQGKTEYSHGICHVPAPGGFAVIPPGTFTMGSPEGEKGRRDDEGPQHEVTITRAFYLQKTEVTQAEWNELMDNNPSRFSECGGQCPVEKVSWWDALAYANARSKEEDLERCYGLGGCTGQAGTGDFSCPAVTFKGLACRGYRLPTEAEWEYAARAGTREARYGSLESIAWHKGNSRHKTHAVAGKAPNKRGLHDMLGNVWEWVWDRWSSSYSKGAKRDPMGPATGAKRVRRGGGWGSEARTVRAAYRGGDTPGIRFHRLGFRLARSAP